MTTTPTPTTPPTPDDNNELREAMKHILYCIVQVDRALLALAHWINRHYKFGLNIRGDDRRDRDSR